MLLAEGDVLNCVRHIGNETLLHQCHHHIIKGVSGNVEVSWNSVNLDITEESATLLLRNFLSNPCEDSGAIMLSVGIELRPNLSSFCVESLLD